MIMDTTIDHMKYRDDFAPKEIADCYLKMFERFDIITEFVLETLQEFYKKDIRNGRKPAFEHLIDVGCGCGNQTVDFSEYSQHITAIDISESQIEMAKKVHAGVSNVEFLHGSAENIPVDDKSADVIISTHSLQFFDLEKFVAECRRVLKPRGVVVLLGVCTTRVTTGREFIVDPKSTADVTKLWLLSNAKLDQYAAQIGHPQCHISDRFQKLYGAIQGMDKSRDDSKKFELEVSLAGMRKFYSAIPFFRLPESWRILEDFWRSMKEQWRVQLMAQDGIIIRLTYEAFILVLSDSSQC